ncbi:MAG: hypothetical protein PHC28_01400 [Flavobacterium sp.]|uniref:hypothetical protein n=1 Tax=Flavobacterium sp. TaxID=239 RepID=UPI00261889D7|nr:hypothetical protein [Flavobacterium sp.]MDD5149123.1 hypothetical protein [Flavobacterium sp.]
MNKRGQFYILIAVVIIGVLAGLVAVTNYVNTSKTPVKFYDLSEELGIESESVINYGVYQEQNTDVLVENFTDTYSDYFQALAGNSELVFVYGNETNLSMITYSNITTGRISLEIGNVNTFVDVEGKNKEKTSLIPELLPEFGNYVVVNITDKEYKFSLNKGQNFFFVLVKNIGNETYVTT